MKIRKGFVSNSSSSSFLVAFPKRPDSLDELKLMMFGENSKGYVEQYDSSISEEECAQEVFNDLIETPISKEDMIEDLGSNFYLDEYKEESVKNPILKEKLIRLKIIEKHRVYIDEKIDRLFTLKYGSIKDYNKKYKLMVSDGEIKELRIERNKYNDETYSVRHDCYDILATEKYDEFLSQNSNAFFSRFEYSDDDSFGSVMEHGDIFYRLPHVRISHH